MIPQFLQKISQIRKMFAGAFLFKHKVDPIVPELLQYIVMLKFLCQIKKTSKLGVAYETHLSFQRSRINATLHSKRLQKMLTRAVRQSSLPTAVSLSRIMNVPLLMRFWFRVRSHSLRLILPKNHLQTTISLIEKQEKHPLIQVWCQNVMFECFH